jgi:hypothetical protein
MLPSIGTLMMFFNAGMVYRTLHQGYFLPISVIRAQFEPEVAHPIRPKAVLRL